MSPPLTLHYSITVAQQYVDDRAAGPVRPMERARHSTAACVSRAIRMPETSGRKAKRQPFHPRLAGQEKTGCGYQLCSGFNPHPPRRFPGKSGWNRLGILKLRFAAYCRHVQTLPKPATFPSRLFQCVSLTPAFPVSSFLLEF